MARVYNIIGVYNRFLSHAYCVFVFGQISLQNITTNVNESDEGRRQFLGTVNDDESLGKERKM